MDTIIVGIDGSPESLRAVSWAADTAHRLAAKVLAVSVFGDVSTLAYVGPGFVLGPQTLAEWHDELQRQLDGPWLEPFRAKKVDVEPLVIEGRPAEVLVELAAERDASMIVVGRRGHGPMKELLMGSASHALIMHAPCAVVVIPSHEHA